MNCRYYLFPRQIIYLFFLLWTYCNVIDSCCREIIRLRGKYRTTSETINKSTIIAIILLILRSFQRKGLCDSGLKAKSTTFALRLNYIVLRRIASKRPLLFDPKITFFKTFSRNPWQFQKEIVTLWGRF